MPTFRIAILDLYNNFRNEGMRCIYQLLSRAEADNQVTFTVDTFNVRAENQVPAQKLKRVANCQQMFFALSRLIISQ